MLPSFCVPLQVSRRAPRISQGRAEGRLRRDAAFRLSVPVAIIGALRAPGFRVP